MTFENLAFRDAENKTQQQFRTVSSLWPVCLREMEAISESHWYLGDRGGHTEHELFLNT